jgi:hypothetical protein
MLSKPVSTKATVTVLVLVITEGVDNLLLCYARYVSNDGLL